MLPFMRYHSADEQEGPLEIILALFFFGSMSSCQPNQKQNLIDINPELLKQE